MASLKQIDKLITAAEEYYEGEKKEVEPLLKELRICFPNIEFKRNNLAAKIAATVIS